MGWARDPSCRAESVLEPVVSQPWSSGYPRVSKWTDLPMLGLSPGPSYTGHQTALTEEGTPRPDRQADTDRQKDNAQLCPGGRVTGGCGM